MDPISPEPNLPATSPQNRFPLPVFLLSLLILFLLVVTSYLAYQNMQLQKQIRQLSVQKRTPTSAPTPISTGDWKTYMDADYHFFFRYPQSWNIEIRPYDDNGSKMIFLDPLPITFTDTSVHGMIGLLNVQVARHPKDPTYFQKNGYNQGVPVRIGVQNIPALQTEEVTTPDDTRQNMQDVHYVGVTFDYQDEWIYTLSIQPGNAQYKEYKAIFDHILSSFTFLEQTPTPTLSTNLTCPAGGWQNCMPMLTEEAKKGCTKEAVAWYKANCPNFQGVAE